MANFNKIKCRHCGEDILHLSGQLWHSDSPVFPQYCRNDTPEKPLSEGQATDGGGWLHEPQETTPYTK